MYVHSLVHLSVTFAEFTSRFYVKSSSSGVYLTNHSSESIRIWTMDTVQMSVSGPRAHARDGAGVQNLGRL